MGWKGKLIFVGLICILFVGGCAKDCTQIESAAVEVLAQYNVMKRDKENIEGDYNSLKEECGSNVECNTTGVVNRTVTIQDCVDICQSDNGSNCITYINRIEILEDNLEGCWSEEHTNYRDLFHKCRDDRKELREENNETIHRLEDDLLDCHEDLETCEQDLGGC